MNLLNYYTNEILRGGIGNLTFNGVDYIYNDDDNDGMYFWEINTSQLILGSYSFSVQFIKENYRNDSFIVFFDTNKLNLTINLVSIPSNITAGDNFDFVLNTTDFFTTKAIPNVNLSISIDFGSSYYNDSALTLVNGSVTFSVSVPSDALKVEIRVIYIGNGTYSGTEYIFSIDLEQPPEEPPDDPPGSNRPSQDPTLIIIVGISLILISAGSIIFIIRRRRKAEIITP